MCINHYIIATKRSNYNIATDADRQNRTMNKMSYRIHIINVRRPKLFNIFLRNYNNIVLYSPIRDIESIISNIRFDD